MLLYNFGGYNSFNYPLVIALPIKYLKPMYNRRVAYKITCLGILFTKTNTNKLRGVVTLAKMLYNSFANTGAGAVQDRILVNFAIFSIMHKKCVEG